MLVSVHIQAEHSFSKSFIMKYSRTLLLQCPIDDPCPPRGETNCSDGCLYEVRSDPEERTELTSKYPEKVEAMTKRLEELKETAFTPVRCTCDDGFGGISCGGISCADARACETANGPNKGFW